MINFADHLFLVLHDEYTGRARAHGDVLGLTMAAALLVELLFPPEQVRLAGDTVLVVSHLGVPPNEPLQHRVTSLIRRERQPRSIVTWLRVLGADARDQVGGRLFDTGLVDRRVERRLLRGSLVAYPATSPEWAAYAGTRLHNALHDEPMYTVDVMLAALVACAGVDGHVTYGCDGRHPCVDALTAVLPPPLRTLVRHTRTAVAESALSPL